PSASTTLSLHDALPIWPFGGAASYRLIVSRIPRPDDQADVFSGQAYIYRAILTGDRQSSPKQIVAFYNGRGSERLFDVMGNDFGDRKSTRLNSSHVSIS